MAKHNLIQSLFLKGSVVDVKIKIWAGRKKLKPEDLGFEPDQINKDLISLGSKYLIPKDKINGLFGIRSKTYGVLNSYTMDFSFGSFVSETNMPHLLEKLDSLKQEFYESVMELKDSYDESKREIMAAWQDEAVRLAASKNDPEFVFEVLDRIEAAFPDWSVVEPKFLFDWKIYKDIQQIAEEFVQSQVGDIVNQMGLFARTLMERIEMDSLSGKNLGAVRKWIEAMRDSAKVFESSKVNNIMEELESWVQETPEDETMMAQMKDAMKAISDSVENEVDDIVKGSLKKMISQSRKLDI